MVRAMLSVVEKLHTPLTPATEKAAKKLPTLSDMLGAIDGKAPAAATHMLTALGDCKYL